MKLNQKKVQKSGSRYRLEAYLAAGLGSCGLASSAQAGIVTLDLTKAASSAVVAMLMGGAALRKWRKNKNKQDAQEPSSESLAS